MYPTESFFRRNIVWFSFGAILLVYFFNLFIDIMEIDAAQYAVISMEMSWTKSFLEVYQQGKDYLDKPPLLFWLSSLSFIVLGISNVSYKLPSVLIAILGIYSVYRFSKIYYSKEIALIASLILASCQALFLITNDVRTDTLLLGLSMFSIWQLSEYVKDRKWINLLGAAIGIGGAMMAKGPIALIIPIAAFGTEFLLKRQWKNIFDPKWLILLVMVALVLTPMCYGLYSQFDLHPEKVVYELKGPSGLRFFFWTQSFGRITGENYWSNDAGYFYFLNTILWDFQPWVLLFIPALLLKIRQTILQIFKGESLQNTEFIALGGFLLVFIAMSFSKYKLPHYIFVLFPFAAILTADFILELKEKWQLAIAKWQLGIMHLFWLLMPVNFILFFPPNNLLLPLILLLLFLLNWYLFIKLPHPASRIVFPTLLTACAFNLMMAVNFYPNLLSYQSTSQAGKYVKNQLPPNSKVFYYFPHSTSFDFYARQITPGIQLGEVKEIEKGTWVYTNEDYKKELLLANPRFKVEKEFNSYPVTALEFPFLHKDTRSTKLKKEYLLKID